MRTVFGVPSCTSVFHRLIFQSSHATVVVEMFCSLRNDLVIHFPPYFPPPKEFQVHKDLQCNLEQSGVQYAVSLPHLLLFHFFGYSLLCACLFLLCSAPSMLAQKCLIHLLYTGFQVQGTNDNSIVSKCSMSAAGYFNDPFLKNFVAKNAKRAPLINRFVFY